MHTKYEEVMDRVRVTDEMRSRILRTLEAVETETTVPEKEKITSLSAWKNLQRLAATAACVALLLLGGIGIWHLTPFGKKPVVEQGVNGMEEVGSLKILERYWGDMAEITYIGADEEAVFRKAEGTEDVSGDYNAYAEETSVTIGAYTVRLKGESGSYTLATWTDGTYAYSLQLTNGQPQEVWQAMIESME